eukprot:TRINITY_DN3081_c0_g1_i1.p1 TRINITY_DN3081_c0_g1~~TRINITY_DN3081_c0_g1_i1.p1  ORF type:complete len:224 (-),score=78.30 TRINITY_DN3081_c0_g1_i1:192-863(-)
MAAADTYTVYVGGVSYDASEQDVSEHFSKCGEVVSVRMPTFPDSGRSKGIAFVEFADKAGSDAALDMSDSEFMGRNIKVDVARGKSDRNDRRGGGRDRSQERYGGGSKYGSSSYGGSSSSYGNRGGQERRNRSPAPRQKSEPSDSVFIGNLSFQATERDLEDTFADCGRIVSVRIPNDRNSGRPKGFGYITFDSEASASKALSLSGTDVAGRSVRVDYAASRN